MVLVVSRTFLKLKYKFLGRLEEMYNYLSRLVPYLGDRIMNIICHSIIIRQVVQVLPPGTALLTTLYLKLNFRDRHLIL